MRESLKSLLEKALNEAFPSLQSPKVGLDYPDSPEHGDYASNIGLRLSKELQQSPHSIAEQILSKLPPNDLISKTEIAGPGFINLFLSEKALHQELQKVLSEKERYGSQPSKNETIIVEYSSPNIAKPLGIHHILSTIIGQTIANLLKFLGYDTVSINYIGDWGTQFGKLITAYRKWGDRSTIEKDPIPELLKLYVKFHDEAEKDPSLEDQARHEFKIFEEGDTENRKLWQWFVDESLKDTQKTYDKLGGIHFDHYKGEAFIQGQQADLLQEGKEAGIFIEGEGGAYIVEYQDPNMPPFLVQKSDGATLYSTRDFATIKWRIQEWNPKKILYIVGPAQILHFRQLFTAAQRFPWYQDQCQHITFGRMSMKDSNMSTRKGNVVLLDEVLDEGISRAQKIITEKSPNLKNASSVAKSLGVGAIKYNILSQNRSTNILFDWDRTLSLEGNSGPYLQYTYARARSILRKEPSTETMPDPINAKEKVQALLRLLPKFPEALQNAAQEYKPNLISNYLYHLAQEFNSFYNSIPVLKAPKNKDLRLQLVEATSQILQNGLALLGIEVVEEM